MVKCRLGIAFAMLVIFVAIGCNSVSIGKNVGADDFYISFLMRTDGKANGLVHLLGNNSQPASCEVTSPSCGLNEGKPFFRINGMERMNASYRIDDGEWHEIAVLGHNGRIALMVDEFVEMETDASAPIAANRLGIVKGGFKGEIKNLRIDNSAMENPAVIPVAELEKNRYNWTNRHERILREAKSLNPEVVMIGDSITHAWAGPYESLGGQDAWHIWKRDFNGIRALNLGYGFDRTQNLLWRIDNGELDGLKPKLVVLLAGINNLGTQRRKLHARGNTSWETAEGVIAVRERIREKLPDAHVLVMGVFPRGREKVSVYRLQPKAVNEILRRRYEDDANTTYVDAWGALLDKDGILTKEVSYDSVHLTAEGFRRWRAVLDPSFKKYL